MRFGVCASKLKIMKESLEIWREGLRNLEGGAQKFGGREKCLEILVQVKLFICLFACFLQPGVYSDLEGVIDAVKRKLSVPLLPIFHKQRKTLIASRGWIEPVLLYVYIGSLKK